MSTRDWKQFVREHLPPLGLTGAREQEIFEEIAQQLDDAFSEGISHGLTREQAEEHAVAQIPDWNSLARDIRRAEQPVTEKVSASIPESWREVMHEENIRSRRGGNMFADIFQDLRYAFRVLSKTPGFTAIAVLTLALGIGANTALFSVVNAVLLRPLPVRDPQQLVALSNPTASGQIAGLQTDERTFFTYHEFEGLRDNNQVLSGIFAFSSSQSLAPVSIAPSEPGSLTQVEMVSGGYFGVLGVSAELGHTFSTEVDQGRNGFPQVVLSHAFWQRRMQADPAVIGKKIRIRQTVFDVIGVMPPTFTGIVVGSAPEIWTPVTMRQAIFPGPDRLTQPPAQVRRYMFFHIVGRLKPGVSLAQANTSLNVTFHNLLELDGSTIADSQRRTQLMDAHINLRDARHGLSSVRGEYEKPLFILMGLVGLLLLLACANVANLFLARASGRERELAVRVALGSNRGRLVRQLLTESILLSAVGAAAGLLLAQWGDRLLLKLVSEGPTLIPLDTRLDATVLAFTLGMMLFTGILFGLIPALRATRLDLNLVLRGAARNISGADRGAGRLPMGKILVGTQVAISLLLLITAGLFVRSLQKLTQVPLGYEAEHLLLIGMNPLSDGYQQASIPPLFDQLLAKIKTIPGVRSASLSENGLFSGNDSGDDISIVGSIPKSGQDMNISLDEAGPGYFQTIGIPVLAGRDVESRDTAGTRHMWLNQSMSKYFFGAASPLGQHIAVHYSFGDIEYDVVGVVGDAKYNDLRGETDRRGYFSYFDPPIALTDATIEVRTAGDDAAVISAVRQVIHETNAGLATLQFQTIPALIDSYLVRDKLIARLSTFFGIVAMVLACIGLYGVLSYNVSRRIGEMGVRMALGAQRFGILQLVIRDALLVTVIGVAVGLGAALAATRVLGSMLFGLSPRDPVTMIVAAVVLIAVATLAAFVPAWRASRVDPMTALRYE
jgi:predicted permease